LPLEKLKLSYDNQYLFSGGKDGVICIFDVRDREPKFRKDGKDLSSSTPLSDEVLIPKMEADKFKDDVIHLKESILNQKIAKEQKFKLQLDHKQNEINRITKQIETDRAEYEMKREYLESAKREMEIAYD
jgi:WD40 repeat protein